MNKQKINFWIMSVVGIGAFAWMLYELIRVLFEVVNRSGVLSIPLNGVVQHKIGELMVAAPVFLILLFANKWTREKVFNFINRMQIVMIIGGLLNGLAWYSLRDSESLDSFFRIWCLIILFVGLFGAQIAKFIINRAKNQSTAADESAK